MEKNSQVSFQTITTDFYRLAENLPDNVMRSDVQGRCTYANPVMYATLGWAVDTPLGKTISESFPDGRFAFLEEGLHKVLASGEPVFLPRGELITSQGRRVHDISLYPERDEHGNIVGVLGIGKDVTELHRVYSELAAREEEFRTLVENASESIVRLDTDLRRIYLNPAWERITGGIKENYLGVKLLDADFPGREQLEFLAGKLQQVIANKVPDRFEYPWVNERGEVLYLEMSAAPEFDAYGKVVSVLTIARDITLFREQRERIQRMAYYDTLTELPNRAMFLERLQQLVAEASRNNKMFGVLFMDLDRFKDVNDTHGHHIGDALLQAVGQRLRTCIRENDMVARLGGDEFGFLMSDIRTPHDLGNIAHKLTDCFMSPFAVNGIDTHVEASIGISIFPKDSQDIHELMRLADTAMYSAKKVGRSSFCFYEGELSRVAMERVMLGIDLRHALQRKELEVYYQPQVRFHDQSLIGAEALLRWKHPVRGFVSPAEFIPLAEDQGLIVEIGDWVLTQACVAAVGWAKIHPAFERVSVNLSAHQIAGSDLAGKVQDILKQTQCPPRLLELEITESALLKNDDQVREVLNRLRQLGISISIDDFGTGFSALSYLTQFSLDSLKIDRSFIDPIGGKEKKSFEVVKAIVAMAHCLGLKVVAEGVETQLQADLLRSISCDMAQGYYYGYPEPHSIFEGKLKESCKHPS